MITVKQKKDLKLALEYLYKANDIAERNMELDEEKEMVLKGYLTSVDELLFLVRTKDINIEDDEKE